MKKKVALLIVIPALLLSAALVILFFDSPGGLEPKTVYVDSSNAWDPAEDGSEEHPFDMIQEGVDSSSPGFTIYVASGTYRENVVISKSSISIVAEKNTIVHPDGAGTIMHITGHGVTISGFTMQDGQTGIRLDGSNNTLRSNNIRNNSIMGVVVSGERNLLRENHMQNNTYNFAVEGSQLSHFIQDIDTSNTVNGKPVYYLTNQRNLSIDSSTFKSIGYLGVVNSTNVNVRNLTLKNNGQGVLFAQTRNSTIENANILDNLEGIALWDSHENTIESNTMLNNKDALTLVGSKGNEIKNNTISQNYLGVRIKGSSGNTFHLNNFLNNTFQAEIDDSMNIWDYSGKGNRWSDYNGTDQNGDNIGDTPYVINENNQDNYPLMTPEITLKGDLNGDRVVNELDLSIWEQAAGSYPGHSRWNPIADLNGDSIVDIYDAAVILINLGKTG